MKNQALRLATYALSFAVAFVTAARQDVAGFNKQKELDDSLKFDWGIHFHKWMWAAIPALLGAGSMDTLLSNAGN